MNRKLLIPALFFSVSLAAQQAVPVIAANGVYHSDTDFITHTLQPALNKKEVTFKSPPGHFHELWLKTKDSTYKFYDDEIWGYRKNSEDYRLYNSEPYRIIYSGKIIIYKTSSTPGSEAGTTLFFSKDPAGPVYELRKKQLLTAYHDDTMFIQKVKQLKATQSLFKWNAKTNMYVFVEWINEPTE